jgi:acyl carrier protein
MTSRGIIRNYIETEFLDPGVQIDEDHPLLESGILNSLGVMRLVAFAEREFQIRIPHGDVNAQNFSTVTALAAYVDRRRADVS